MDNSGSTCGKYHSISPTIPPTMDMSHGYLSETFYNDLSCVSVSMNDFSVFDGFFGRGPTGPTGPIGPQGTSAMMYKNTIISLYCMNSKTVNKDETITFEDHTAMIGNCHHVPGTSEIFLWTPGIYLVYYNVYHVEPCQLSLLKNNAILIPGSTVGSLEGMSNSSITFVMKVDKQDCTMDTGLDKVSQTVCKLQLINKGDTAITLIDEKGANNILPQISASLSVVLIHKSM